MAKKDADAQYKIDKEACSSLSGNAKDICVAEAKGKDNVAKADAEALYTHTPKARESARVAHAQATYDVSIEKCDDLAGNPKDVCVKEAKAAFVRAKADAKVDRVALDTRKDATAKQAEATQGSERRQARRRLQGSDREVRCARGPREGRMRQQRKGAVRQVLRSDASLSRRSR